MPTAADILVADPATVEDEFCAIVAADDDLVRAEFDAIIAAEWPSPPSDPPDPPEPPADGAERSPRLAPSIPVDAGPGPTRQLRDPDLDRWRRPRSPPFVRHQPLVVG